MLDFGNLDLPHNMCHNGAQLHVALAKSTRAQMQHLLMMLLTVLLVLQASGSMHMVEVAVTAHQESGKGWQEQFSAALLFAHLESQLPEARLQMYVSQQLPIQLWSPVVQLCIQH
jgi:hypothetical protein